MHQCPATTTLASCHSNVTTEDKLQSSTLQEHANKPIPWPLKMLIDAAPVKLFQPQKKLSILQPGVNSNFTMSTTQGHKKVH